MLPGTTLQNACFLFYTSALLYGQIFLFFLRPCLRTRSRWLFAELIDASWLFWLNLLRGSLARLKRRWHQHGVNGKLDGSTERESVGDDFNSPVILPLDVVDVQVEWKSNMLTEIRVTALLARKIRLESGTAKNMLCKKHMGNAAGGDAGGSGRWWLVVAASLCDELRVLELRLPVVVALVPGPLRQGSGLLLKKKKNMNVYEIVSSILRGATKRTFDRCSNWSAVFPV